MPNKKDYVTPVTEEPAPETHSDTDGDTMPETPASAPVSQPAPAPSSEDLKNQILKQFNQREEALKALSSQVVYLQNQVNQLLHERATLLARLSNALRASKDISTIAAASTSEVADFAAQQANDYNESLKQTRGGNQE